MSKKLKIALLGGTGKAGKFLLNELLHQSFPIRALVRNPENLQVINPLLEIIKGDARDPESVSSLLYGCEAVISTLGQPKGETTIFSQATKNVIQSMVENNIHRYILITGLNVNTPFDNKGTNTIYATNWMKDHYPETTSDKQREYEILVNSNIDWTLLRLPKIEQTIRNGKVIVSLKDCPGDKISATALSHFIIEQLADNTYIRKAPFIASN